VTLIIGVTASMFTAIFVTRWIMDAIVARNPNRLSV
jgi:preprotein translocase subunit SecD